jgi:hypothetical protein
MPIDRVQILEDFKEIDVLSRKILHEIELQFSFIPGALEFNWKAQYAVQSILKHHKVQYEWDHDVCKCDCDVCAMCSH